jgi:hypothetical protein
VDSRPTLVVSCTDRKASSAARGPNVGDLPGSGGIAESAIEWGNLMSRARESGPTLPVRDLYQGEYWSVVRALEKECEVRVASAGLGMCTMDTPAVSYRATFSPGSSDSVTRLSDDEGRGVSRALWWRCLRQARLGEGDWTKTVSDVVLVSISSYYQDAIADDLISLSESGRTVVVMSGSPPLRRLKGVDRLVHIETGQWLRMILGGSTPVVGIRFAAHIVESGAWARPELIREALTDLEDVYRSNATNKLPAIKRRPGTDQDVRDWIVNNMAKQQIRPSKSTFLRLFRSEGLACEQARFGRLFDEVRRG